MHGSSNRMLKNPASGVLSSQESSTYPRGYASGSCLPAALLDGIFEHPAKRVSLPCDAQNIKACRNSRLLADRGHPGELSLHPVDLRKVTAHIVVAASLAEGQTEAASYIGLARPGSTQMNHRGQVLFPLKRDRSHSPLPDGARDGAIQLCCRQFNSMAWCDACVEAVEPARIDIIPRTVFDHPVIVDTVAFGFAERGVGDLIHTGRARRRPVQLK